MTIRVNGELLPEGAVEFELQRLVRYYSDHMTPEALQEEMPRLRERARDQAIGGLLLRRRAEALDIEVPEDEVDDRVQQMIQRAGGREAFEGLLRQQQLTLPALRDSIRSGRRIDRFVERLTGGCPDPTEREIEAFFATNAEQYRHPPSAQVQHILIRATSASAGDRAVARSRLQDLRAQALAGGDFADLAFAHSDCPSGKRTGGSLGWIAQGSMVPELDRVIFALSDGDVSEVVESTLGFHVFLRTDSRGAAPAELDEVREKVRDLLRHDARGRILAEHVSDLRAEASIEID